MATRRSQRLTSKVDYVDDGDAPQVETDSGRKSRGPSKKAKTGTATDSSSGPTKVRRKRGLLEAINNVPIDILFEIFSHLQPLDLLHLARTSKDIRAFLMSRNRERVWRNARENISGEYKLPGLPAGMCEPKYASFLYDKACLVCFSPNAGHVEYHTYMRICTKCLCGGKLFSSAPSVVTSTVTTLPTAARSERYSLRRNESPGFKRQVSRATPYIGYNYKAWCHVPTATALLVESAGLDQLTFNAWIDGKAKEFAKSQPTRDALKAFHRHLESGRASQDGAIRNQRYADIKNRLRGLGWTEELEFYDSLHALSQHKLVNQPKALTERIWKNLEPKLVEFMKETKAERIKIERLVFFDRIYEEYIARRPDEPILPSSFTVADLSPFCQQLFDEEVEETFSKGEVIKLLDTHLLAASKLWRADQEAAFKAKLASARRSSDLGLAVSAFSCSTCVDTAYFPEVLVHRCRVSRGKRGAYWDDASGDAAHFEVLEKSELKILQNMIRGAGFDPDVATWQEMDAASPIMACKDCLEGTSTVLDVYRWSYCLPQRHRMLRACSHFMAHKRLIRFAKLEDPVLLPDAKAELDLGDEASELYACKQCNCLPRRLEVTNRHIMAEHGVSAKDIEKAPKGYSRIPLWRHREAASSKSFVLRKN